MCAHLQDIDLSPNLLCHLKMLDLAFIQDLNRDLQSGDDMMSNYHI